LLLGERRLQVALAEVDVGEGSRWGE